MSNWKTLQHTPYLPSTNNYREESEDGKWEYFKSELTNGIVYNRFKWLFGAGKSKLDCFNQYICNAKQVIDILEHSIAEAQKEIKELDKGDKKK